MIDVIPFWWAMAIWAVLSFIVLMLYLYIWTKVENRHTVYGTYFRRCDIMLMIIFFPITVMGIVIYALMWVIFKILDLIHFEDLQEWMMKPLFWRKDEDE